MSKDEITHVPMNEIDARAELNCRGDIKPIDVVSLANDIETRGLIQPIAVCLYTDVQQIETGKKYRLLAGFRRFTAHKVNEAKEIAAIVRPPMSEIQARFYNLAENIQRKQLNIVQEARALIPLIKMGVSEADAGKQLGVSRGWCQVRFMLMKLPDEIIKEVEAGYIKQENIRELYAIYNTSGQESAFEAARKIKDGALMGKKVTVNPNKTKVTAKHHRKRAEIFSMQEYIFDHVGHSFATRCLAWAAGEITSQDLYMSLESYAKSIGKTFTAPEEDET